MRFDFNRMSRIESGVVMLRAGISSGVCLFWIVLSKLSWAFWARSWLLRSLVISKASCFLYLIGLSPCSMFFCIFFISDNGMLVRYSIAFNMMSSGSPMLFPKRSFGSSLRAMTFPSVLPIFRPVESVRRGVVMTNLSLCEMWGMSLRPRSMLNIWSFPPISRSTSSATLS